MPRHIAHHLAVGYIRLSPKDERKKTDLGPEAQRREMEQFAAEHRLTIATIFHDLDVSGKLPLEKRPGLQAAIAHMKELRAGILLVHKRDRLARGAPIVVATIEATVEELGAQVWSAVGTPNERTPEATVMRRVADAFAEYEREQIRARTVAALAVKKKKGECVGGVPYGYRAELVRIEDGLGGFRIKRGALVPVEEEQLVLATIRKLRTQGLSQASIAAYLNAEGIKPRGTLWHPTTIQRIVTRDDPGSAAAA